MDSASSKVVVIFLVETPEGPSILLHQREGKEGVRIVKTKILDIDAFSGIIAGARAIIQKLGQIDIRELSFIDPELTGFIDWDSLPAAQEKWDTDPPANEHYELVRNPQTYMWQRHLLSQPLWNDENNHFITYFIKLQPSDLEIITKHQRKDIKISLVPLSDLANQTLSTSFQQFLNVIPIASLIQSGDYLKVTKTFIFLGFKLQGFRQFSPPRPLLHTFAIFDGLYRRRQEKWLQFNVPDHQFPNEQQLATADALILCGSSCSSYDDFQWIRDLEKFLFESYHAHKHLKYLTICFGLQVISQAFGGKVDPFEQRKTDKFYYLAGNETLQLNTEILHQVPAFKNLTFLTESVINQAHGDEITVLPESFLNVGQSKSCKNEVLISKDYRIFGFQGHPEYSTHQQQLFAAHMWSSRRNCRVSDVLNDPNFLTKWPHGANNKLNRDACMAFLKN